ncbi:MAG: sigma-70 family RNA polymerase sigma factor [Bacteroidales bacterium]|nr:sigma-70 family RNA polymerase sigma factor [Bacteroidales bacterium]
MCTDKEILRAINTNPPKGQRLLLSTYQQRVQSVIASVVGNIKDVEDLTQEALITVLSTIGSYKPSRGTLATWIYTIAYRKAVSFVRQQRPVILSFDDTDTAVPSISDEQLADELSTGREERIQALEQALELLPAHDRLLITLYYYQDCSLAEIASIIGATANAVSHRLHRIREKLYTLLTINA